jgi:hypothetical protein
MNLIGSTNLELEEMVNDLLADSHNLIKGKNYFSQLLNIHRMSGVRQIEVHMAEPLVPGPDKLEFEVAISKLKRV